MIHYLACDGNGIDSIADVLGNKDFTRVVVTHYEDFDKYVTSIVSKVTPKDTVIVDTLNMLASTVRGDINLGVDPHAQLWEKRDKFFKDKAGFGLYTAPTAMLIRQLKNLCRGGEGAKIIVTCHEAERIDETTIPPTRKRAPDLNAELLGSLIGSSSDVCRLAILERDILNDKQEVILPSGTRILQLNATDEYMAKIQVPLSKVPSIKKQLANPTYPMLCEHLGKIPTWLTIYSPSGVGKSTFVTSQLRENWKGLNGN
jgi:hypothetical protein